VLYEQVYCQRGDLENRIKELHYGMEIGRISCSSFWANPVPRADDRCGLRTDPGTAVATGSTRTALGHKSPLYASASLKLGVQVIASVRRIVLHFPHSFPYRDGFHRLALSLRAQTG
jgi:hypothetical protein